MRIKLKENALYGVRRELDISRDALAREMGVASTTAFRVEKGDSAPSTRFIAGLIAVSGKPFEDLFEVVTEDAA